MTYNSPEPKRNRCKKTSDQETMLAEKRRLLDKLRNSLINSKKNNSKKTEEIEFLLKRL
ncbi:MAG: hypothetical protein JXN64_11470 [Spirochaetes bacterium]|nr:hypothetical protein [Spirochaetota bacterium]